MRVQTDNQRMRWTPLGLVAMLLLSMPAMAAAQPDIVPVRPGDYLAWDQSAPNGIEVLQFDVYVDDVPSRLPATCEPSSPIIMFSCRAPVPDLNPGVHVISVAARMRGDEFATGSRSAAIRVRVGDPAADTPRSTLTNAAEAPARLSWRMSVVGSFVDVTDIAVLDGTGVLLAERSGRVHVLAADGSRHSLSLDDVRFETGGLLSIATQSLGDGSSALYAMYTCDSGLRVSRMLLRNNSPASPLTVLVDRLPISAVRPAGVIRIGPDGKLYVALEDGGDASLVGDAAAYEGKVLRLETDGTTPRDAVRHSPIYTIGLPRPADLAWVNDGSSLWVVGSASTGAGRIESRAVARADRSDALRWLPSRAAAYVSEAHRDLIGSVLVGDARDGGIRRVAIEADGSVGRVEPIPGTNVGLIRAVATGADGSVYAATATHLWRLLFF